MIIDRYNMFCNSTALNTGAAGSYLLGDQIDLTQIGRDIGHGSEGLLYLVAQLPIAATSGGSATLQLQLRSDDTATINVSTGTLHASSAIYPVASLTAGRVLWITPLPRDTYERFLGIVQVTGTAAFTAGAVDVFLTPNPQNWRAHADEGSR
jgi:hypothetical protein